ncbi:hypothetical protein H0H93_008968 [Arthromyces matolae]|nr:hypothetical protein H0H93_008968 [Arthromyces matolae]
MQTPTEVSERRSDGQVGRFDPCISPQMSPSQPWLAFVLRDLPNDTTQYDLPEMAHIRRVFVTNDDRYTGQFKPKYIASLHSRAKFLSDSMDRFYPLIQDDKLGWWARRPVAPVEQDFADLEAQTQFGSALDQFTYISRAMKVKASWLEFMRRQLQEPGWSMHRMRISSCGPAEEWWMGTWLNDLPEEMAYWLMRQRVPVFIAHQLSHEDAKLCESLTSPRPDFFSKTEIYTHDPIHDEARSTKMLSRHTLKHTRIMPPALLPVLASQRPGYGFSRRHQWYTPSVKPPFEEDAGAPSAPQTQPVYSSETASQIQPQPGNAAQPMKSTSSKYQRKALDLVTIDEGRIQWIRPPRVRKVGQGKWEKFLSDYTDDGQECIRKSKDPGLKYTYYDRENRREISFDRALMIPPGLTTDASIFGLPAPDIPNEINVHQDWQERHRSFWLYMSRNPQRCHWDLEATPPTPDQLPLIEGHPPPTSVFESTTEYLEDSDDEDLEWVGRSDIFVNDPTLLSAFAASSPSTVEASAPGPSQAHVSTLVSASAETVSNQNGHIQMSDSPDAASSKLSLPSLLLSTEAGTNDSASKKSTSIITLAPACTEPVSNATDSANQRGDVQMSDSSGLTFGKPSLPFLSSSSDAEQSDDPSTKPTEITALVPVPTAPVSNTTDSPDQGGDVQMSDFHDLTSSTPSLPSLSLSTEAEQRDASTKNPQFSALGAQDTDSNMSMPHLTGTRTFVSSTSNHDDLGPRAEQPMLSPPFATTERQRTCTPMLSTDRRDEDIDMDISEQLPLKFPTSSPSTAIDTMQSKLVALSAGDEDQNMDERLSLGSEENDSTILPGKSRSLFEDEELEDGELQEDTDCRRGTSENLNVTRLLQQPGSDVQLMELSTQSFAGPSANAEEPAKRPPPRRSRGGKKHKKKKVSDPQLSLLQRLK